MAAPHTTEQIWQWLDEVKDPEIPVISLVELGIVRDVRYEDQTAVVTISPTYSGCPATRVIGLDIETALRGHGIEVLIAQANNDFMGGYVKYFTDMPATNGYPNTVVFPKDDEMTVVCQGPFNGDGKPPGDIWRGVKRMLTTPSYESAHYTQYYDPELAAKALQPYAKATIGFVGIYQMSFAMGDYIMKKFPGARFVDASEMVDRIKVIKSPEELELVKRCAIMQDGAMKAALEAGRMSYRAGRMGKRRYADPSSPLSGLI